MFRLAVASSALQRVTDTEDTHLGTGRGGVWRCEADLQFVSSCTFSSISFLLSYSILHLCTFNQICIWSHFVPVGKWGKVCEGPETPTLIRLWHDSTVCFSNISASALRLLSVRMDPHIYLQNASPSLCLSSLCYTQASVCCWTTKGDEGRQTRASFFFPYSCLKFILEMYSCCIFESLHKYVWPPNPSPLLRSVNKPTVQLSAPSCPLLHTIYLFTGVATLLTLFFLSFPLFKSSLPCRVFYAKWWIQTIREFILLSLNNRYFWQADL